MFNGTLRQLRQVQPGASHRTPCGRLRRRDEVSADGRRSGATPAPSADVGWRLRAPATTRSKSSRWNSAPSRRTTAGATRQEAVDVGVADPAVAVLLAAAEDDPLLLVPAAVVVLARQRSTTTRSGPRHRSRPGGPAPVGVVLVRDQGSKTTSPGSGSPSRSGAGTTTSGGDRHPARGTAVVVAHRATRRRPATTGDRCSSPGTGEGAAVGGEPVLDTVSVLVTDLVGRPSCGHGWGGGLEPTSRRSNDEPTSPRSPPATADAGQGPRRRGFPAHLGLPRAISTPPSGHPAAQAFDRTPVAAPHVCLSVRTASAPAKRHPRTTTSSARRHRGNFHQARCEVNPDAPQVIVISVAVAAISRDHPARRPRGLGGSPNCRHRRDRLGARRAGRRSHPLPGPARSNCEVGIVSLWRE